MPLTKKYFRCLGMSPCILKQGRDIDIFQDTRHRKLSVMISNEEKQNATQARLETLNILIVCDADLVAYMLVLIWNTIINLWELYQKTLGWSVNDKKFNSTEYSVYFKLYIMLCSFTSHMSVERQPQFFCEVKEWKTKMFSSALITLIWK